MKEATKKTTRKPRAKRTTTPKKTIKKETTKEIVSIPEKKETEIFTEKKLIEYLNVIGISRDITDAEKKQFIEITRAFKLNPYKKEIFISSYGEGQYRRTSILMGYPVFLKRAERTSKLSGWKCVTEGDGNNIKAVLTIHRKDWSYPFIHEVYFSEVAQYKKDGKTLTSFWRKMPKFMTKKVCISQGFRMCFPDELGGLPYTDADMPKEEWEDTKKNKKSEKDIVTEATYEIVEESEAERIVRESNDKLDKVLNGDSINISAFVNSFKNNDDKIVFMREYQKIKADKEAVKKLMEDYRGK